MTGEDSDPFQLRFEDGDLVAPTSSSNSGATRSEPIQPGRNAGFTVEVKSGALDVNAKLAEAVDTHGDLLEFGSRAEAERYAEWLSLRDSPLRIQAAAPNDTSEADAYLLADHNPSITEPAAIDGKTWTFDVGANLYGALGEAVLLGTQKPHALDYFVRQDLDIAETDLEWGLNVEVERGQYMAVDGEDGVSQWLPDCVITARDGWSDTILERYYCEIKAGEASFERSQVETMRELARDNRVLKIRVDIDDLPEQYSIRIHEVESPD